MDKIWKEIENELVSMRKALAEVQTFQSASKELAAHSTLYKSTIGSIAMNLQSFYTGAERILIEIAKGIDNFLPQGSNWHRDLLEQLSISTELRPAFLSSNTLLELDEFRGFRHVIRNAYVYNLDAQKVLFLANRLNDCYQNLYEDYLTFRKAISEQAAN